ncbi:MAG TPA: terminase family protein [Solirubrobacteraceae bacterium]|nr:terminase family protein [Solirubrobacteraceae bacterium]
MPDLQSMRDDLATFATEVGCPLEAFQARALALRKRTSAVVAPRQSGKSRSLAVLALHRAYGEAGHRVLIVSAGEEASRRLLSEVRRIAQGSPLLRGSVTDEMAGLLTLSNGSEIRSVPASERQIRGWSVGTLLVDECALVSDDLLLGAAYPTTAARPDAKIMLASSATTAGGSFYDHVKLAEAGSEHVEAFRWSLTECPWISPSAISAARESMSELRFSAEYEGVFAGSSDSMFPRHVLDRATVDYLPDQLDAMPGPARVFGGVDWGLTTDRSALVAIARLAVADGRRVFAVRCAHRWPEAHLLHNVVHDIASSPGHFDKLCAEANGVGGPCCQQLFQAISERSYDAGGGATPSRVVAIEEHGWDPTREEPRIQRRRPERSASFVCEKLPVHTTAALKAASYSSMRMLLDRGALVLPASCEDLTRELLMLRVDLNPSGTERIEAVSGAHDDLPDAMMLALVPYRRRAGGDWQSFVANLANPASQLPEPMIPSAVWAQDHVPGPDGMQVPRRPAWVSPCGDQVSTPAGLDLTDPAMRDVRERVRVAYQQGDDEHA